MLEVLAGLKLNGSSPLVRGKTVTVPLTDGAARPSDLLDSIRSSGVAVQAVGIRQTTLNDVFLHLTGAAINVENGS